MKEKKLHTSARPGKKVILKKVGVLPEVETTEEEDTETAEYLDRFFEKQAKKDQELENPPKVPKVAIKVPKAKPVPVPVPEVVPLAKAEFPYDHEKAPPEEQVVKYYVRKNRDIIFKLNDNRKVVIKWYERDEEVAV